jgi:cytochrome P450
VIDNINSAVAGAMDELFSRPDQLAGAAAAAQAGNNDLLRRYVLEALRFQPPAPLLVRFSLQEYTLARHTERETKIPAGKVVFASNSSAMMDDTVLDEPQEFKFDRPEHAYLHFGWGLHQCLGKFIAETQLVEIMKSLLLLKGLRRASGSDGELKHLGAFPGSFIVEFDTNQQEPD